MTQPHDHRNRTLTVVGIALALFLGALDQTIVSTALPRIVDDLGGLDRYTWVTTAYLLISTLLVPLYGKLSDMINRKTLELISVVIFLLGSILCGLSGQMGTLPILGDAMNQLVVFRGLQGIGGAGLFALAFIIISDLYPPRERGKIGGVFGAVFGLSSVLGPLIGGFLTDNAGSWISGVAGWRWVFYVNVPVGIVALWFLVARMPRLHPRDRSRRLDFLSAGLMMAAFFPIILGLQLDKGRHSWSSPEVVFLLAAGIVGLVVWVVHSLKVSRDPILNLRLFKNPVFLTGVVATFFFGAGFLSILVFLPLYMVNVQGVSATQAGASIIPLTLGIVLGAAVGGALSTRWGRYKVILLVGGAVTLVGGLFMTTFGAVTPYPVLLIVMIVTGVGFGPAQSLYSVAVQNAVSVGEVGQATSFSQFSRQIGATVGAALAGALFSAAVATSFAAEAPSKGVPRTAQLRPDEGPREISAKIGAEFDKTEADVVALFNADGDDARRRLADFLADPRVPSDLKDKLKNGTPALQIEALFDKLWPELKAIVIAGDLKRLNALYSSEEGRVLPESSREGIRNTVSLDRAHRLAALPDLERHMEQGRAEAIDGSTMIAVARVKSALEHAKQAAQERVMTLMARVFARALQPVWWLNFVLLALLLATTAVIPARRLRGRGDHPVAPSE